MIELRKFTYRTPLLYIAMIESTNLEISNTQNEAVHPIRGGVLNALISGLKLILIPTDCSDHSRISIKYGIRLAQESNAAIKLICVRKALIRMKIKRSRPSQKMDRIWEHVQN